MSKHTSKKHNEAKRDEHGHFVGKNCYKEADIKHTRDANGHFVPKNSVDPKKDPFVKIKDIIEDGIMSFRQAMYEYENKPVISRKSARKMLKEFASYAKREAIRKAKWRIRLSFIYGMCFPAAFYAGWHYLYPLLVK